MTPSNNSKMIFQARIPLHSTTLSGEQLELTKLEIEKYNDIHRSAIFPLRLETKCSDALFGRVTPQILSSSQEGFNPSPHSNHIDYKRNILRCRRACKLNLSVM